MDEAHHWKIITARGDTTLGVCQHCGAARTYSSTAGAWYGVTPPVHCDRGTTTGAHAHAPGDPVAL